MCANGFRPYPPSPVNRQGARKCLQLDNTVGVGVTVLTGSAPTVAIYNVDDSLIASVDGKHGVDDG
jgi:hypothetical protein